MPTVKDIGMWVDVIDREPKTSGIKFTLTKDNFFGIATFYNNEWIHLLPTYLGEVQKWFEFVNSDGEEIEFVTDPTSTKEEINMKQSAGTIIINDKYEILMGHVTNSSPEIWDLPKGMVEDNEAPIDAAIRECQEEFGFILEKNKLAEIGNCPYNNQKKIWLFITSVKKEDVDISSLKCNSMFNDTRSGEEFPEVNAYKWMKFSDIPYDCAKSMNKLLHSLHGTIHTFGKYGVVDKFE